MSACRQIIFVQGHFRLFRVDKNAKFNPKTRETLHSKYFTSVSGDFSILLYFYLCHTYCCSSSSFLFALYLVSFQTVSIWIILGSPLTCKDWCSLLNHLFPAAFDVSPSLIRYNRIRLSPHFDIVLSRVFCRNFKKKQITLVVASATGLVFRVKAYSSYAEASIMARVSNVEYESTFEKCTCKSCYMGEPSFHLFGFIMCVGATAARALKSVLQGILLFSKGEKLNSMNLLLYMAPIAVVFLLPATLSMEENVVGITLALARDNSNIHLIME
ncbi:uncharacterized protein LOC132609714 isoform X2 [Lycium barbarum]|uniref:uncharacterized protein LOC132609714 isoform X2 n=1 Tax=Lycium barbarum TaxID=112863 RepID=UPI00293E9591|nr:uncharacterized protein LOC132609714 isoform X2 [Lycium barbarum]